MSDNQGTYFIDAENAAEMARLTKQARGLTTLLGGSLPEIEDFSAIHAILDIACGPGEWLLDIARLHPTIQCTGIDVSQLMIEYAGLQAKQQNLSNASFQIMNALQPLDFPDHSFDVVNARLIFGFTPTSYWPKLVQECVRILRPGGILRFSEFEMGVTTGPYSEQMTTLLTQAMKVVGHSFAPDGRHLGTIAVIGRFLHDAGFQDVRNHTLLLDYSYGLDGHIIGYESVMVLYKLLQPLFIRLGLIIQEEMDLLYQQTLEEVQSETFCGVMFYSIFWGHRPK